MSNQEKTLQTLIQVLEASTRVQIKKPREEAGEVRQAVLEEMIRRNEQMIQNHIIEMAEIVRMKLPQIEEAQRINTILRERIAAIQKEGERPTVPTETRPPKQAVNS